MTGETTSLGRISISTRAIASIASHAAIQSYGIVGMAPKSLVDGIANAVVQDPAHGVDVRATEDQLFVDLYVIVEYGTRISSVTQSVANSVRYHVERALGMPVAAINVHVQDLRVSNTN